MLHGAIEITDYCKCIGKYKMVDGTVHIMVHCCAEYYYGIIGYFATMKYQSHAQQRNVFVFPGIFLNILDSYQNYSNVNNFKTNNFNIIYLGA